MSQSPVLLLGQPAGPADRLGRPRPRAGRTRAPLVPAWCCLAVLLLSFGRAWAMPPELTLDREPDRLPLAGRCEALREPDHRLTLEAASQATGWSLTQGRALNWGVSTAAWWVRLRLRNPTDQPRELVLDTGSAQQDAVEWFLLDPGGGRYDQGRLGDRLPFGERRLATRALVVPLTVPPGRTVDVYLRCDTHDGLHDMLPLTLSSTGKFARQERGEDLLLSLFHGGLLLLAVLSLVLLCAFPDRSLLFYALYLGSLATYSLVAGGFDVMYLWPDSPRWHNALALISGMCGLVFGNAFAIAILRAWYRFPPWLWRAMRILLVGCLAGLIPLLWDGYLLTFLATLLGLALTLLTLGGSVWLAWRGDRDARLICAGFTCLIAGVCVFYLDLLGMIPSLGWSTGAIRLGACIQLLLFSLTLALSMRRLQAEKLQAEDASRAKAAFLAAMTHEIRTPLGAILGFAQLSLGQSTDARQRERIAKILRAGRHLLGIIDNILDFSKIDGGHLRLERIPFSPRALLTDIREMLAVKVAEKGLALVTEADPNLPQVLLGDPLRIRQILLNFANNAVKFSASGTIVVRLRHCRTAQGLPCLHGEVEDQGIGLDPQQTARLFEPFTQADVSYSRRFGGTGLGLAISRSLAELMGGEVGVRRNQGKGSLFWFRAQVFAAPPEAAPLPDRPQQPADNAQPVPQGRRILLVDDNEPNRLYARELLESYGLLVDEAAGGLQAIERLTAAPDGTYDLVFMDMMMPECDGLEATRRLRAAPRFKDLPIVAMTANAGAEDVRRCLEAGMWDHLAKPAEEPNLRRVLSRFLPPDAPTSRAPLFDPRRLRELGSQASPQRLEQVVALLVADCRTGGQSVAALAARGDTAALRPVLHDLIGCAGNAGLPLLEDLCRDLGGDLRAGTVTDVVARADRIAAVARESVQRLREAFPEPDGDPAPAPAAPQA